MINYLHIQKYFFFKAATDTMYFIYSNNTQTILDMGLGTCQDKGFYAQNCTRLPAISNERPQYSKSHTVLLKTK